MLADVYLHKHHFRANREVRKRRGMRAPERAPDVRAVLTQNCIADLPRAVLGFPANKTWLVRDDTSQPHLEAPFNTA